MSRHAYNEISKIFIENRILHLAGLVAEHSFDFVVHGFPAGGAEMDHHSVGGFADFLHKRGTFVPLRRQQNRTFCGDDVDSFFFVHITPFVSKPSIHRIKGLQRIMSFPFCPFGQIMRAANHDGSETLLTAVEHLWQSGLYVMRLRQFKKNYHSSLHFLLILGMKTSPFDAVMDGWIFCSFPVPFSEKISPIAPHVKKVVSW